MKPEAEPEHINGYVGQPQPGFVRLRIRSQWDDRYGMNFTRVYAVAFDGTETEVSKLPRESQKCLLAYLDGLFRAP
ncbi:MAG TPA: hypothetical protein VK509_10905 [Polyangiales bacterium]|nr:hypothetical protein [Polyangiales bacterium]